VLPFLRLSCPHDPPEHRPRGRFADRPDVDGEPLADRERPDASNKQASFAQVTHVGFDLLAPCAHAHGAHPGDLGAASGPTIIGHGLPRIERFGPRWCHSRRRRSLRPGGSRQPRELEDHAPHADPSRDTDDPPAIFLRRSVRSRSSRRPRLGSHRSSRSRRAKWRSGMVPRIGSTARASGDGLRSERGGSASVNKRAPWRYFCT